MINSIIENKNIIIISLIVLIIFYIGWYIISKPKDDLNVQEEQQENISNNTESNLNNSKIKIYNFNTSWCKYSVMFAPEWSKLESMVENDPNIEVIDVKCDDENNESLCQTFEVPGFPSVVIMKDNTRIDYEGPRNAESILEYVKSL